MKKDWYLLVTKSRHEKKSNLLLNKNGFETYLPIIKQLTQWSDRKKLVEKPLFSGYIFVKFSQRERFNVINTDGISYIIKFENKDYIIDENLINGVKEYLSTETSPTIINSSEIKLGENVLIKNGPFSGIEGIVSKIKGKNRLLISLEIIGKAIVIDTLGDNIEIINSPK